MNANTELFQIQLKGEDLIKAHGLCEMHNRLQQEVESIKGRAQALIEQLEALLQEVEPPEDQAQALIKQLEALKQQIEEKREAFDAARVSFFADLEKSLGIDVDATSLEYEGEGAGAVYLRRTQQDVDRREALRRLKGGNPLGALMGLLVAALEGAEEAEEDTPCDNPSCSTDTPPHTVH